MNDTEFDRALIAAAFTEAGISGWHRLNLAAAARAAGLDAARARLRFPGRCAVLVRFGTLADAAAIDGADADAPVRDTLFDMLMRRIDVLQAHRAGMLALLRTLPFDPFTASLLAGASLRSMAWMLDAAGIPRGPVTPLRTKALLAVWLWTVRAWQKDETTDLAPTMAALDEALRRAETAESWLRGRRTTTQDAVEPSPDPEPPAEPQDPDPKAGAAPPSTP